MDIEKLYDRLLNDETISDIPIDFVIRVVLSVFEIIGSGECFYNNYLD